MRKGWDHEEVGGTTGIDVPFARAKAVFSLLQIVFSESLSQIFD
jgi:hypothetical protein